MSLEIRVGGTFLSTVAGWGDLTYSHAADGGCKEASWQMDLPPTYTNPLLNRGQIVEVKNGEWNAWAGLLTEPDMDDSWTFHAVGLSALGKDYLCFDGSGNTTSTPDTAVDQAISRGIPWTRPASLSASGFTTGDSTAAINYVGDLLDAWAPASGKRWGVNADRQVYAVADPTVPTYFATPGSARFGLADDDYASDLYIRYVTSGGGYATATVGDPVARTQFGRREYPVDATSNGLMNATQAQAIGNGLLAKGKARLGYTNGAEFTKYELTTPGGQPACLEMVKGGELVRMFGVLNEQGQPVPYVDWVIGETSYEAGADTIALTPVGLVERNLSDALTLALSS